MRGDSCSEGCGFEFQHRILDGYFFTLICCKKLNCLFEKDEKYSNKRPGMVHFDQAKTTSEFCKVFSIPLVKSLQFHL